MDKLGVSLAHCESQCDNFYDAAEVERVFYPEMEKLLLEFFQCIHKGFGNKLSPEFSEISPLVG